jgi:hypothetical protein
MYYREAGNFECRKSVPKNSKIRGNHYKKFVLHAGKVVLIDTAEIQFTVRLVMTL